MFGKRRKRRKRHERFKEYLEQSQYVCNPIEFANKQHKLGVKTAKMVAQLLEESIKK